MTTPTSWMTAILFTALVSSCASSTPTPSGDPAPTFPTQAKPDADFPVAPNSPTTPAPDNADECGDDWSTVVDPLFAALAADAEVTTTPVAQGCRSTSRIGNATLSVLVEPVAASAIDDVASARQNSVSLMGFVELGFVATDDHVASSLFHPETGRLVESRWVQLDATSAMRVEVTIDADGQSYRDLVLHPIATLEVDAANYQRAKDSDAQSASEFSSSNGDVLAVSHALDVVLSKVSDTLVLDPLATDRGADAIAFEYAFPDNFAAVADAKQPDDCSVDGAIAHCNIDVGDDSYRFAFARIDSRWLLDNFAVTTERPPTAPNEE